jgi:hypothetical protein
MKIDNHDDKFQECPFAKILASCELASMIKSDTHDNKFQNTHDGARN